MCYSAARVSPESRSLGNSLVTRQIWAQVGRQPTVWGSVPPPMKVAAVLLTHLNWGETSLTPLGSTKQKKMFPVVHPLFPRETPEQLHAWMVLPHGARSTHEHALAISSCHWALSPNDQTPAASVWNKSSVCLETNPWVIVTQSYALETASVTKSKGLSPYCLLVAMMRLQKKGMVGSGFQLEIDDNCIDIVYVTEGVRSFASRHEIISVRRAD